MIVILISPSLVLGAEQQEVLHITRHKTAPRGSVYIITYHISYHMKENQQFNTNKNTISSINLFYQPSQNLAFYLQKK